MIDPEEMYRMFSYNPQTGVLTRKRYKDKIGRWNTLHAGKPVTYLNTQTGYLVASVKKQRIAVHRIIYAIMRGRWPRMIDHINRDKTDNRWGNLRETDHSGNAKNTKIPSDNKTGVMGVRRHANGRGFVAFIAIDKKQKHLCYGDLLKCAAARLRAEREHGYG